MTSIRDRAVPVERRQPVRSDARDEESSPFVGNRPLQAGSDEARDLVALTGLRERRPDLLPKK